MTQDVWVDPETLEIFFSKPTDRETVEMEIPLAVFRDSPDPLVPGRRFLNADGTVRVQPTPEVGRKRDIETQIDQSLSQLDTYLALLQNRAPTAAESRQILAFLIRIQIGLVRLLRNNP